MPAISDLFRSLSALSERRIPSMFPMLRLPLLAGILLGAVPLLAQDPAHPMEAGATQQSCLAANCHAYRMAFRSSPHSVLDTEGLAEQAGADFSCAACHGPFEARPEEERAKGGCAFTVLGFREDASAAGKAERCLTCHRSDHGAFPNSSHGLSGLDCTSCHEIHGTARGAWPLMRYEGTRGNQIQGANPSGACKPCHLDAFHSFEFADRHRLREGILECISCHDPHEPSPRWRLGGFKQEACGDCHRDKVGPFFFEHGSVRVEGCTACHTPHGSPNRHLLTFDRVAELCFSCHSVVPGFHSRFDAESQCTSCHSRIHGSNLDPAFLR